MIWLSIPNFDLNYIFRLFEWWLPNVSFLSSSSYEIFIDPFFFQSNTCKIYIPELNTNSTVNNAVDTNLKNDSNSEIRNEIFQSNNLDETDKTKNTIDEGNDDKHRNCSHTSIERILHCILEYNETSNNHPYGKLWLYLIFCIHKHIIELKGELGSNNFHFYRHMFWRKI